MTRQSLIPVAYLLDQLVGDPESLPHPVRLIGAAITFAERHLLHPSPRRAFLAGTATTLTIVAGTYYLTAKLLQFLPLLEVPLAATTLAARNLQDEAESVLNASTLTARRQQLSRIVGRDTAGLSEQEVARALIETLAESASDGILAPLFYLALGGVPLAMAYKAVNTLDSMIGHHGPPYEHFGKFAARLDDCANYLPARLTALAIAAVAHSPQALRTWRTEGANHKSPNAGQPEAAMAGALGIRLGGHNTYAGELIPAQFIAPHFPPPTLRQARHAVKIVAAATLLSVATATLLLTLKRPR